eukprot:133109_1
MCESTKRIKHTLDKLNASNGNIYDFFAKNNYTSTILLNDFNHIKYHHHVEDNDSHFAKIFTYITEEDNQICDIQKCKYINIYYRNRSKYSTEQSNTDNEKNRLILDLLSRIHVYFIHSYQINRLTLNETYKIEQQLESLAQFESLDKDEKDIDHELLEERKIELTTHHMKQKMGNLNRVRNQSKYIEANNDPKDTPNENNVNFQKIHEIIKSHNISITETAISEAFSEYQNDKNKLISHVIDTYYAENENSFRLKNKVNPTHVSGENDVKIIYQCILYEYIDKSDLNTDNFVKIIRLSMTYDFDIDEFAKIATEKNISGKIFVKKTAQFLNKV